MAAVQGARSQCPSPLNLGPIDLSDFGGSGRIEDGSEAVFGLGRSAALIELGFARLSRVVGWMRDELNFEGMFF